MKGVKTRAGAVRHKHNLQDAVLKVVAVSGIVLVGAMAPNVLQLLKYVPNRRPTFNYKIKSVALRLAQKGLVRFVRQDGKVYLQITSVGKRRIELQRLQNETRARLQKPWDKRWRMVVFDIPERRRAVRAQLRMMLHACGFLQIQQSVWVFPHDCEEIVALVKAELQVGKAILYVIVESLEHDKSIRKHFKIM